MVKKAGRNICFLFLQKILKNGKFYRTVMPTVNGRVCKIKPSDAGVRQIEGEKDVDTKLDCSVCG